MFIAALAGSSLPLAAVISRCGSNGCGRELLLALGLCTVVCGLAFPYPFYAEYEAAARRVTLYRRIFGLRWVLHARPVQGAITVFLAPDVDGGPMVSLHLGEDASGEGSLLLATQPDGFDDFEAAARELAAVTGLPAWREGYVVTDGRCSPAAGARERLAPPAAGGADQRGTAGSRSFGAT